MGQVGRIKDIGMIEVIRRRQSIFFKTKGKRKSS